MQFQIPNKTELIESEFSALNEKKFRLNLKLVLYSTFMQQTLKDLASFIHLQGHRILQVYQELKLFLSCCIYNKCVG